MATKSSPFAPNIIRDIIDQIGWLSYSEVEPYLADITQDMNLVNQHIEKFVDQEWASIQKDMEEKSCI